MLVILGSCFGIADTGIYVEYMYYVLVTRHDILQYLELSG